MHYVPTDSNFGNLSAAVRWAREHDRRAQAIVVAANRAMAEWTSTSAIYLYTQRLLHGYASLPSDAVGSADARAVRFACVEEPSSNVECRARVGASSDEGVHAPEGAPTKERLKDSHLVERQLTETRCFFTAKAKRAAAPGEAPPAVAVKAKRYSSLYEATVALLPST